ncbi:MAG: UvrB/UvrC motif-containing protein, partial [Planctomycetota bacterium]
VTMILCQKCKKNIATVHLTEMKSGQRNETHLCEECAKGMNLPHKHPISLSDLIGAIMEKSSKKGSSTEETGAACPKCGITFKEFESKGRLGCEYDYTFFKTELDKLLAKVQGSSKYIGKAPKGVLSETIVQNELMQLKNRLNQVVKAEQYEEAAQIRDRIIELENQINENISPPMEVDD